MISPNSAIRSVITSGEEQLLRMLCGQLQRAILEGWSISPGANSEKQGRSHSFIHSLIHSFKKYIHTHTYTHTRRNICVPDKVLGSGDTMLKSIKVVPVLPELTIE